MYSDYMSDTYDDDSEECVESWCEDSDSEKCLESWCEDLDDEECVGTGCEIQTFDGMQTFDQNNDGTGSQLP